MTQPYTYLIGWTQIDNPTFYWGRLTTKNADPQTFWIDYFTSSKKVPGFRKRYGEPDIIWTYPYETRKEAIDAENNFLEGILKSDRHIWLNQKFGASWGMAGRKQSRAHIQKRVELTKGKTYEEIYGTERAAKLRQMYSELKIGNKNGIGKRSSLSEEHKEKIRQAMIGKNTGRILGSQSRVTCDHCGTTGGVSNMTRYHFKNCRNKK